METRNKTLSSIMSQRSQQSDQSVKQIDRESTTTTTAIQPQTYNNFTNLVAINLVHRFPDPTVIETTDHTRYLRSLSELCLVTSKIADETWRRYSESLRSDFREVA